MKYYSGQLGFLYQRRDARRNLSALLLFIGVLVGMVLTYSVVFHYIMMIEGREFSWITGVYWTLTVMSTLGFGDITFESDLGRAFSILVLLSGIVFLLILLPFTIIQFFYAPWLAAQALARTPTELPNASGHVLLTHDDAVTRVLGRKLKQFGHPYYLLVSDREEAARLHDEGHPVVVGDFDDPETYTRVRADKAALIVATNNDMVNTHIVFTVRGISPEVPVVATANSIDSVDIMELAGATKVFRLGHQMGQALVRCIVGGDAISHVVGNVEEVQIAEANAARTPMVGKTLREAGLREIGVSVLGLWNRGEFEPATADTVIGENSILMLAGSRDQLEAYDEAFVIYNVSVDPIVIIGAGRVGRAAAASLKARGIDYRIIDKIPERAVQCEQSIEGDAADIKILKSAGIEKAPAVLITTHDDDLNVYLTIYCRSLRPDIQIITRSTLEWNVAAMHRAGADFVMSYASMGATSMFNLVRRSHIVAIAEGLEVFRILVPAALDNTTIVDCGIREGTGCSIVAVGKGDGFEINPSASTLLSVGMELVLVGNAESEQRFLDQFSA
ncbi:MAG: voltage-gated potassium channel [Phycisphaerales bacterium]|jgi:voltage-gated potassium channel